MIKLIIDNKEIEINEGTNLLKAILDNGIYVPNLCYIQDVERPSVSCRLCFVEIEGQDNPIPSCAIKAEHGMIIKTDTPNVRRLQRTAFELLLSVHNIDCRNCSANKRCELQKIARFLHVPLKQDRIEFLENKIEQEEHHPYLIYVPDKCVMCGRCVNTCKKLYGSPYLSFVKRGLNMKISFFGETDGGSIPCNNCYACVETCPVAALLKKNNT
jgi:bidirectional [NiFe] hydrogenase diaphorase subunit